MSRWLKVAVVAFVIAALGFGALQALAKPPAPNPCPTPRAGCFCPEIYAPVLCDGNCQYSNDCFAHCARATNCHPIGPGPIEL